MRITVFTPAYNRGYIIEKLFCSLQRQTYTDFECEGVSTTIPFTLTAPNHNGFASGTTLTFLGKSNGTLEEGFVTSTSSYRENEIIVEVVSVDWGKALAGDYSATITFTAEVVAE